MKASVCGLAAAALLLVVSASAGVHTRSSGGAGLEELEALAADHPDSAELWAQIASLRFAEGTIPGRLQAADCLKRAIGLVPENPDYHLMLAEIYFAATYWNYGIRELQRAVAIQPGHAGARTRLGKAYMDRAIEEWQITRFKQARQELKRALSIEPRMVAASSLLALCELDLGRPDSALALVRRLPEDSLTTDALLLEATALMGKDRTGEAWEAFQQALGKMDDAARRRYLARGFWIADTSSLDAQDRADGAYAGQPARHGGDRGTAYLTHLWERDDPDPSTRINERLLEHLARVSFADLHFSVPRLGRPGSETTRGEVYCRYGRPRRWYYDPFGTNSFAGETVSPGQPDLSRGDDPFANLAEIYRPTPLRLRKPRWVWLYDGFTLSFEDTHLNGDYTFPYELDWSAYVDAYLRKNLPAIYQSEIRTRMRVALDAVNRLDDRGLPAVRILFACDTRGIEYTPGARVPSGDFEVEVAFLDSAYAQLERTSFRARLSADSLQAQATRLPLAGSWQTRPPPGAVLAALSLRSLANGALGYATAPVLPRQFGGALAISDLEVSAAPDRLGDPLRVFSGCAKVFIAFDLYNVDLDGAGHGQVEVTYRLAPKAEPPALMTRLLRSLTGRQTNGPQASGRASALAPSPLSGMQTLTPDASSVHNVIPLDVASLVEGEYIVEVEARDALRAGGALSAGSAGSAGSAIATVGITLSDSPE